MMTFFNILAVLAATIMGFSIQRGATCTVAALDEIIRFKKINRLLAMIEAAIWVAVGLGLATHFGIIQTLPNGFEITYWTVAGAMFLGLGAFINGACVFGGIARLGSGQWGYAFMPIGYFLGCLSLPALFNMPMVIPKTNSTTMDLAASALLWPLTLLLLIRASRFIVPTIFPALPSFIVNKKNPANKRQLFWTPHSATLVIGVTFLITLIFAGKWAYTEVLLDLATGMKHNFNGRIILAIALFLGAFIGGQTKDDFAWSKPSIKLIIRCLIGGAMMAWGSLLIPGSNDGILLIGMPLLWPYAWLAFATMCISIAFLQLLKIKL